MSDDKQTPEAQPPVCDNWILGDIDVQERAGEIQRYRHAILVSFKTAEEYFAARKYLERILSGRIS